MKKFIFFLSLLSYALNVTAQDKVQVMTTLTGPREIAAELSELDALINRALVRVTNLTNNPLTVVVEGTLTGPDIVARTVRRTLNESHYITLAPRATEVFTGDRIRNTFSVLNVEFFIPSENRIAAIEEFYSLGAGSAGLPEGNYDFCFQAYEVNPNLQRPDFTRPIHSTAGNCVSVQARVYEPPLLQSLNNRTGINYDQTLQQIPPNPDGSLRMQWQAPSGLLPGTSLNYQILIAELLPDDPRNPNQVIEALDIPSEPLAFYRETVANSSPMVTHILHLGSLAAPFQVGRVYAVQIRATSPNPLRPLPILNEGRSPVTIFTFQGITSAPFTLSAYPPDGSYMPFRGTPVVVKFDPYRDSYRRFESDFAIRNTSGDSDAFIRNLPWSPNPLEAQRTATGDPGLTQIRAQHIALSPTAADFNYTYYNYPQRGDTYTWQANIAITEGSQALRQSIHGNFVAGMDMPVLQEPANHAVVDTGEVSLRFLTAETPEMTTLTPFDIVQASRSSGTGGYDIRIHEKAVLEVSRNPDFSVVLHHKEYEINKVFLSSTHPNESLSWTSVVNEVYRNEEARITARDTGSYYWRVRWLKDPTASWNSEDYNRSLSYRFIVKADSSSTPAPTVATTPCGSPCEMRYTYSSDTPQDMAVGETVHLGQFRVEITEISTRADNHTFSGRGIVTNFGFIVDRVLIDFKALRLKNTPEGKRAYEGSAKAVGGGSLHANMMHLSGLGSIGPDGARTGSGGATLTVPFGWDQSIEGHKIIAMLDSIGFSPTSAKAKFRAGYEMPGEFAGHPLELGAEICIAPGGFREEFDLTLERDLLMGSSAEDSYQVVLRGRSAGSHATKFSWDCRGFKALTVGIEVKFSRDAILPENHLTGVLDTAGRVSGNLTLRLTRDAARETWGFIGNFSFPKPFQFTSLPGWGFQVQDAVFDFSDSKNEPGMRFPAGYDHSLLGPGEVDDRLKNTWTGFYLKNIQVSIPQALTGDAPTDPRKSFNVQDFLIDRTGFTGFIGGYNLFSATDDGWKISVDTLRIGIVQTRSISGHIAGTLGTPFFEAESKMNYRSLLTLGFSGKVEYQFQINVPAKKPLKMKLWQAAMRLEPTSYLRLTLSTAANARFQGRFDGHIGIDSSQIGNVPGLSLSGIKFENFAFDTEDPRFFKFSRANRVEHGGQLAFAFASPQHSAAGFPLNITDIRLSMNQEGGNFLPTLGFTTELSLSDVGFKAKFGLDIVGEMIISPFSFRVKEAVVKEVGIDVNYNGFQLGGALTFYNNDPTFGDGIHGKITAALPMGISGKLEARFGTIGSLEAGSSRYDYWYVDGMIKINPGITIFSGFAIYGFGGGAYYNMTLSAPPRPENAQNTLNAPSSLTGGAASGLQYRPNKGSFGIMATVILGTQPNPDVFNMDVTLQAQFNTRTFGLESLRFEGNGYVMSQMADRSGNPPVRAKVVIGYYNMEGREFVQGNFQIFLNVYDAVRGAGTDDKFVDAEIYADMKADNWWFYMGKDRPLDARGGIIVDIPGISIDARSYIMVGHGIPADLPPLPQDIREILFAGAQLENQVSEGQVNRLRSTGSMQNGQGFAFGVHFKSEFELNFLMFYAKMGIALGFDANISQNFSRICAESGVVPGIDGWFAQGQAYAALTGEMGIKVDLFFVKGEFKFIDLRAAIAMQAKLPNPNYFQGRAALTYNILNGTIHGRCNFNIELGEPCSPVSQDPLQGLSFISEINVSDPGSVFSDVQTAFNFAMNEVLELEESSGGETVIRRFMPFVQRYEVKTGTGTVVNGTTWKLQERGYLATLSRNEAYESQTEYKAEVEVRCYELFPNGTRRLMMKEGTVAKEAQFYSYTTGDRPQNIEEVVLSYPIVGQRHFHMEEGKKAAMGALRNKGYLKIKQQDYLFQTPSMTLTPFIYNHSVRFTPAGGGEAITVPLNYNAAQDLITFDMPNLRLNTTYTVDILKIARPNPAYPTRQNGPVQRNVRQIRMEEVRILEADNRSVSTLRNEVNIETRSLATRTESGEFSLYTFLFKTSQYPSFSEKMATLQLGDATYRNGIKTLNAAWGEGWDAIDKENLLKIRSENNRNNAQLAALQDFYTEYNRHRHALTRDHTLPSGYRASRAEVYNPNPNVTLLLNRNGSIQSLSRLSGEAMELPKRTYTLSGSFAGPVKNAPAKTTSASSSTLSKAGFAQSENQKQYTLLDAFDWHAVTEMERMKSRLVAFAVNTFARQTLNTNPTYYGRFDGLDGSTRGQVLRLSNTAYPFPQAGYRYSLAFEYEIPLPDGRNAQTATYNLEYILR